MSVLTMEWTLKRIQSSIGGETSQTPAIQASLAADRRGRQRPAKLMSHLVNYLPLGTLRTSNLRVSDNLARKCLRSIQEKIFQRFGL